MILARFSAIKADLIRNDVSFSHVSVIVCVLHSLRSFRPMYDRETTPLAGFSPTSHCDMLDQPKDEHKKLKITVVLNETKNDL